MSTVIIDNNVIEKYLSDKAKEYVGCDDHRELYTELVVECPAHSRYFLYLLFKNKAVFDPQSVSYDIHEDDVKYDRLPSILKEKVLGKDYNVIYRYDDCGSWVIF